MGNVAAESVGRVARATTATQGDYLGVGKLLLDADNLTHFLVVPLLSTLLFDCLLPKAMEKREQGASACFLEFFCLEFWEQLVRQVQIWGF